MLTDQSERLARADLLDALRLYESATNALTSGPAPDPDLERTLRTVRDAAAAEIKAAAREAYPRSFPGKGA